MKAKRSKKTNAIIPHYLSTAAQRMPLQKHLRRHKPLERVSYKSGENQGSAFCLKISKKNWRIRLVLEHSRKNTMEIVRVCFFNKSIERRP